MKREMTKEEVKKNPGKAVGQLSRRRGQINRLTARAEKAEKLAATRLHGRAKGKPVPPSEPAPTHAGLGS